MPDTPSVVVCFSTVANQDQARQVAETLLGRGVAACVQIDGPIESHYRWDNQLCRDPEYRLVIKSSVRAAERLRRVLREIHPYDVPQIVTVASVDADADYAEWVDQQVVGH